MWEIVIINFVKKKKQKFSNWTETEIKCFSQSEWMKKFAYKLLEQLEITRK